MTLQRHGGDQGFTLVEVLVALALLALISLAALAVLSSLAQTSERTQSAIARISRLQRAAFLMERDFDQASQVAFDGRVLTLLRSAPPSEGPISVRYRLSGKTLAREVGPNPASSQTILTDLQALEWRFLTPDGGWQTLWTAAADPPRAAEIRLVILDGPHARPLVMRRYLVPPATP